MVDPLIMLIRLSVSFIELDVQNTFLMSDRLKVFLLLLFLNVHVAVCFFFLQHVIFSL